MPESAQNGAHETHGIAVLHKRLPALRARWNMWKACADSCAGVTPYCSFLSVGYDISCGGFDPKSSLVRRRRPGALSAAGEA